MLDKAFPVKLPPAPGLWPELPLLPVKPLAALKILPEFVFALFKALGEALFFVMTLFFFVKHCENNCYYYSIILKYGQIYPQ
ncbi:MAG: hypothetical protein NTY31_00870 [Candidatus Falkowbacteria bacterium]|nr:hypothetical protein [Candidatus Falkowbacteria bacterium]